MVKSRKRLLYMQDELLTFEVCCNHFIPVCLNTKALNQAICHVANMDFSLPLYTDFRSRSFAQYVAQQALQQQFSALRILFLRFDFISLIANALTYFFPQTLAAPWPSLPCRRQFDTGDCSTVWYFVAVSAAGRGRGWTSCDWRYALGSMAQKP